MQPKTKKVLIITYYWPPSAGGGVQRWLKYVKHLPSYGWEPIVYTPDNPDYSLQDSSLLTDVADEVKVLKLKIWEPYGLLKIFGKSSKGTNTGQIQKNSFSKKVMSWVRGNLFVPDPRKFWVNPSVSFLTDYIQKHDIGTIVTTGPPHSMHLIGQKLKARLDINWIVDIRDPWSKFDLLDHYYILPFRRSKYTRLEKIVLDSCDKVLATSPSMITQLVSFDSNKFQAITNGYDASDFRSASDLSDSNKCLIYHAGLISSFRNPTNLWEALNLIGGRAKGKASGLSVQLVGSIESSVIDTIQNLPSLYSKLKIEPYKSHEEVLVDYQKANILLLLVNNSDNARVNIPGKAFEYLASRKPIICVSQRGTDVWQILEQYDHVFLMEYKSPVEKIVEPLAHFLETVEVGPYDVQQYSRHALTGELVKVLEAL